MEGQAVCKSHHQEECQDGSEESAVLASTPAMRGLWSCTTSHMSKDLYPAEHPFIWNLKDSDDPEETLYAATTTGFPLYKGSYVSCQGMALPGFQRNDGDHFISFPIKGPDGDV